MKTKTNDEIIANNIFKMYRMFRHEYNPNLAFLNLTLIQFHALIYISQNNLVSNNNIASDFQITLPTATSLVDKLIELKLVKRNEDVKDRRKIIVSLTKKGIEIANRTKKMRCLGIDKILSKLSENEKNQLVIITNKLLK